MPFRVPEGQRGAGKKFMSKRAYLEWCADEIQSEKAAPVFYTGTSYIQRKMLGKTRIKTVRKGYARFSNV